MSFEYLLGQSLHNPPATWAVFGNSHPATKGQSMIISILSSPQVLRIFQRIQAQLCIKEVVKIQKRSAEN